MNFSLRFLFHFDSPDSFFQDKIIIFQSVQVIFGQTLKGIHGSAYTPPPVGNSTGFDDVPVTYWAAAWIKQFALEGITAGCSYNPPLYCPEGITTQAQMSIFLLRSKYGGGYTPPPVGSSTGFNDVPTTYWAAAWIKQLRIEGISTGCGGGNFCPDSYVTRAQMAGLFVRTFNLP